MIDPSFGCEEEVVVDDTKVEFVSDAFDDGVLDVEIWDDSIVDDSKEKNKDFDDESKSIGEVCDDFLVDDVLIEYDAIDDSSVADCMTLDSVENEDFEFTFADNDDLVEEFTEYDKRMSDDDCKDVDVETFFCSDVEIKSEAEFNKLKEKEDT